MLYKNENLNKPQKEATTTKHFAEILLSLETWKKMNRKKTNNNIVCQKNAAKCAKEYAKSMENTFSSLSK